MVALRRAFRNVAADCALAVWVALAGLLFVAEPVAAALDSRHVLEIVLQMQAYGRLAYLIGLVAMIAAAAVSGLRCLHKR